MGTARRITFSVPVKPRAQAKHVELLQALTDAKVEIDQLSAENLKLHEANGDLHDEIAHLKEELAALKAALQPQADA